MTIAYAPYDIAYATRTPIISPAEFSAAPTAQDVRNLIPGNAQAQAVALQETINRASSWCDTYCFGAYGSLASTAQLENARVWGSYRNTLLVHPRQWPITEVRSFSYSALPGGLSSSNGASITPSGNITIYPQEFEVAITGVVGWGINAPAGIVRGCEYDTSFQYVAGFPNTLLAASVAAGASSVSVASATGIYPGSAMTIFDLPNDEPVTVASSYVPGATTIPLTTTTQFAHPSNATLSNLPPAIKQACIWATVAFIKQRGSGALVVSDMGATTRQQTGFSQDAGNDFYQAMTLLNPFRTTYVGY